MSLATLLESGVKIASGITSSLQCVVQHMPWTSDTDSNVPIFGAAETRRAIVEYKMMVREDINSEENVQSATILFLDPIPDNGAPNRTEPIDPRDLIILPGNTSGPIKSIDGLMNPITNRPFYNQVTCGNIRNI